MVQPAFVGSNLCVQSHGTTPIHPYVEPVSFTDWPPVFTEWMNTLLPFSRKYSSALFSIRSAITE
jgi:hypothetical protein